MPSRVIREGLLSSEAVAALHDRTFRLYVALILSADDFGLVEIGYGPIREATALLDGWNRELVAKMLGELTDARLILPYEVGRKRYAALDRWGGYINSRRPKHPLPSWGTTHITKRLEFKDAATRIETSQYFKHLVSHSAPPVPHQRVTRAPPVGEEVRGKREEIKKKKDPPDLFGNAAWECPDDVDLAAWSDWLTVRKKKKAATSERAYSEVLAKLEAIRHAGLNPSTFVAKSANSGWTDIYPPEGNGKAKTAPQQNMSDFGAWDTTGANINLPPPKG